MSLLAQATRADDDLDRVESAGLGASQTCLARIRTSVVRAWRTGHQFSISNELLNHLAPVMSKTLAVANLMGRRRVILGAPKSLVLDRFSEVTKLLKASGLDVDLPRAQKAYARVVYDSLRDLGSNADATTRSAISHLIAAKEPPGRAVKILNAVLDKAGLGDLGQSKLETLYRTQSQIAYQTGRWAKLHERWDDLWGFRYVTMHDDRVRPEHQMLDGTTLPKDDPFWQVYWPPNGWNCRCQCIEIYKTPGVKPQKIKPAKLNGEVPKPDEGFGFNPGIKNMDALAFALSTQWGSRRVIALDSSFDESKHPRGAKGTHEGGQFVSSHSELHYVKSLGSSTGAELHEDAQGNKYVVKKGKKSGQAENEYLANQLYRAMGVPVPKSKLIDGKLVMKYIDGKTLNELNPAERAAAEELLRKHFAADAVMANWDVIGLNHDNIVVDKKGIPWRVDNGGSLSFRAQGSSKGHLWNSSVSELNTMRQQGTAGAVFGSLSNEQVKAQIQGLGILHNAGQLDRAMSKLSDADKTIFSNRLVDLKSYKPSPIASPSLITPVSTTAMPSTGASDKLTAYKLLHDQIKIPLAKKGLSTHQIEQTALANSLKPHPYQVLVSKDWSAEHHNAIAEQFPGKTIKATKLGPIIKKELGTNVTKVKAAKKQGNLASIFSVTATEKKWAIDQAKTPQEKASAEALNVVEAKPAVFLPSNGSPHWAGREKIENGSKFDDRTEKGTYHKDDEWALKLTPTENDAIANWKGSPFSMRKAMWTGKINNADYVDAYDVKHAKAILSGAPKAPRYEGVLYRGVSHIKPGTEFYQAVQTPGNVIELTATMGCSRRSGKSVGSFSGGQCLLRVATKSGRSIEDIHGYKHEHETLVSMGTKFRVVGVAHDVKCETYDKKGKYRNVAVVVDLEEVEPSEKSTHQVALSLWEIPQRR